MDLKNILQDWYWKDDRHAIKIVNEKIIKAVIFFNNNCVYDVRIYDYDNNTLLQHYYLSDNDNIVNIE